MEKLRFEITAKSKKGDDKTTILCLTSISTAEGDVFVVPDNLQDVTLHTDLIKTDTFKKVKNSISKRHQKRNVWIQLDDPLRKTYVDISGNIQFADYILEEQFEEAKSVGNLEEILDISRRSSRKNVNKLAEKFVLEKFNTKNNNVSQWMELFESECERLNLQDDTEKIEVLRLFLEGSCTDWYSSMLIKFTISSEWQTWKDNFCETYMDKGWSTLKFAIGFKYINGSLLDYALKKEKLLLEMDKSINAKMVIILIAAGLPDFVTDKIDKANVQETKDLFNEIKSLEHLVKTNAFEKKKHQVTAVPKERIEKKSTCKICEKLGKRFRYHPEESCWFKTNPTEKNQIKLVNNSLLECELQEENSKN